MGIQFGLGPLVGIRIISFKIYPKKINCMSEIPYLNFNTAMAARVEHRPNMGEEIITIILLKSPPFHRFSRLSTTTVEWRQCQFRQIQLTLK